MPPLVELRGIVKRFPPGILANDSVDLALHSGEVHALLGENGAGKSTLMQILYGLHRKDAGTIRLAGQAVEFAGPHDAIAHGIGMIHQEFMLVRRFTVAENVAMGGRGGRRDMRAISRSVAELSQAFGLAVDPSARIEHLSVGQQQRVEILKLLYRDARVLILDEPTAVLTPQEVARLFAVLHALRADGRAVVIVTHKLREVMAVSDRVTVLRGGRVAATLATRETDERELARLMVGRPVVLRTERATQAPGPCLLEVEGLRVADYAGHLRVDGAALRVHAGEIVGLAGVDGNGQSELVEALFGLRRAAAGRILLRGKDITRATPAARRAARLAYLPADRRHVAAVPDLSLADNAVLGAHRIYARGRVFRDRGRIASHARALIARFDIRATGPNFAAGRLSGGNLQKLVLGREIARDPEVLIVEQPTRGLDIGAIETVWAALLAQRAAGRGLLLVSAELEEILSLSDRIAVMHAGRIVGVLPVAEATPERLGLMMAGQMA